jgi:hypothetical protein
VSVRRSRLSIVVLALGAAVLVAVPVAAQETQNANQKSTRVSIDELDQYVEGWKLEVLLRARELGTESHVTPSVGPIDSPDSDSRIPRTEAPLDFRTWWVRNSLATDRWSTDGGAVDNATRRRGGKGDDDDQGEDDDDQGEDDDDQVSPSRP